MDGDLALDTSIVIAVFAGDENALHHLALARRIFLPVVVLGELNYGARLSSNPARNTAQVEAFAAGAAILPCDEETARHYAALKHSLKAKGRPIPENDLWIAAIVRQHQLMLVTRDRHFEEIEDLRLGRWET